MKGNCYVLFRGVGDLMDADLIGDIGHFVLSIYSCSLHGGCAKIVAIGHFIDALPQ